VRDLVQAFCLFGHRAWTESVSSEMLASVLFGESNEPVVAALGLEEGLTADEEQQQESATRAKTPLEVPKWPLEWEQDLGLLQEELVAHASS
jgi:sirohydrochlorin ferrochelatase